MAAALELVDPPGCRNSIAYWVGRYRESLEACLKLLMDGNCPAEHHERILTNGANAKHQLEE